VGEKEEEMKLSPFAAATSTLIDRIAALTEKAAYETARERQALLDEAEALRVGWRVLEAAGKVDSVQRAIQLMKQSSELRYCNVIHLLESIPDKEKANG
jgi:hypothetical protein